MRRNVNWNDNKVGEEEGAEWEFGKMYSHPTIKFNNNHISPSQLVFTINFQLKEQKCGSKLREREKKEVEEESNDDELRETGR